MFSNKTKNKKHKDQPSIGFLQPEKKENKIYPETSYFISGLVCSQCVYVCCSRLLTDGVREEDGRGKRVGNYYIHGQLVGGKTRSASHLLAHHPTSVASRVWWHHDGYTHVRVLSSRRGEGKKELEGYQARLDVLNNVPTVGLIHSQRIILSVPKKK
jgi:hypothetical protein